MADLGELKVKIRSEGGDDASESIKESAIEGTEEGGEGFLDGLVGDGIGGLMPSGGGAGGGMMSMMGSISTAVMGILGGIAAIAGILLSMEPIQKMLSAFMKVIQAFFVPLAQLIIKLLSPVLKALVKLLPKWLDFWQDPIGNITEAMTAGMEVLKGLLGGVLEFFGISDNQFLDKLITETIDNPLKIFDEIISGALSPMSVITGAIISGDPWTIGDVLEWMFGGGKGEEIGAGEITGPGSINEGTPWVPSGRGEGGESAGGTAGLDEFMNALGDIFTNDIGSGGRINIVFDPDATEIFDIIVDEEEKNPNIGR